MTDSGLSPLEELDSRHDDLLEQLDALDQKIISVLNQFTRPSQNQPDNIANTSMAEA